MWRLTVLNLRARLAYRGDLALALINGILWQASMLLFLGVIITRFGSLAGWSAAEVFLLASVRLTSHSFFVLLFGNTMYIGRIIENGTFNIFHLRPLPLLLQVQLSSLNIGGIGDLAVGSTLLVLAVSRAPVPWTPLRIALLITALAGGVLLEAGIQLLVNSLSFKRPSTFHLAAWLDELTAAIGWYPLGIFPPILQALLVTALPIAFAAYLPLTALLGKGPLPGQCVGFAAPAICAGVFMVGRKVWYRKSLNYDGR